MPKSDSAPPGTIWAQLQPNQPHRKPVPAVAGTHSAHECTSAPGKWTVFTRGLLRLLGGKRLAPPPPKKNTHLPHPKKSYHYSIKVTISEKSSRRDEGSAHTVTFLKMHQIASPRIYISKNFRGACRRTPPGSSWPLDTRGFFRKR